MALSVAMAIRTNRSSVAITRVFGAGKTTALSYLLVWLALTTQDSMITVVFRENPAGEAIAQNLDNMHLTGEQLAMRSRPVGREHYNAQHPHLIDVQANKRTAQVIRARVLICTTGIIHQSAPSFQPIAYQHLRQSNLLVCEEAQQLGEVKSAYAQSLTKRDCFHLLTRDDKQSHGRFAPGPDAAAVRERLSVTAIGLRAKHNWTTPQGLSCITSSTIEKGRDKCLDLIFRQAARSAPSEAQKALLTSDADISVPNTEPVDLSHPSQLGQPTTSRHTKVAAQPCIDKGMGHYGCPFGQDPKQGHLCSMWAQQLEPALARINSDRPVGLALILGILATQPGSSFALVVKLAATNMEACGLAGGHHRQSSVPDSPHSPRPQQIYELVIAIQYPVLCRPQLRGWTIGRGTRRSDYKAPPGFRYIHWVHEARRTVNPTDDDKTRSDSLWQPRCGKMYTHIPAYDPKQNKHPGILALTNIRGLKRHAEDAPIPKGPTGQPIPFWADTTVTLAGATCYHAILFQTGVGF